MRRAARTVWLVVGRVFIALLVGTLYLVSRNEMQWRAAAHDPLQRVALSLVSVDPGFRELLGENLEQLSRSGHAAAAEVIGLVALLERDRLPEARERCLALGWTLCEAEDIRKMHERVRR
jgi:hypothetical protein